MKQEMVVSNDIDMFRLQCEELMERKFTVVPGSVAVAGTNPEQVGRGIYVAFFDPPTSTFVPGKEKESCLAKKILDEAYRNTAVHRSVLPAIKEWLADPDTERSDDETVTSLADAWIEAAHRES